MSVASQDRVEVAGRVGCVRAVCVELAGAAIRHGLHRLQRPIDRGPSAPACVRSELFVDDLGEDAEVVRERCCAKRAGVEQCGRPPRVLLEQLRPVGGHRGGQVLEVETLMFPSELVIERVVATSSLLRMRAVTAVTSSFSWRCSAAASSTRTPADDDGLSAGSAGCAIDPGGLSSPSLAPVLVGTARGWDVGP